MQTFVHRIFAVLALSTLPACASIETWDHGVPHTGAELPSEAERRAEYHNFVIRDFGISRGETYFEVQAEGDHTPRRYSGSSFYPVIQEVCPAVKGDLDRLAALRGDDQWAHVATGTGAVAAVFGPTKLVRNLGAAALLGGVGGGFALDSLERDRLEAIKNRYNADLNHRINLRPAVPSPSA